MNQPFRFLDLPMELRLIVYESLPVTETRKTIITSDLYPKSTEPVLAAVLLHYTTPLAILATCRSIFAEAAPILLERRDLTLLRPKIFVDYRFASFIHWLERVLKHSSLANSLLRGPPEEPEAQQIEQAIRSSYEPSEEEAVPAICDFTKRAFGFWQYEKMETPFHMNLYYEVVKFRGDGQFTPAGADEKTNFEDVILWLRILDE